MAEDVSPEIQSFIRREVQRQLTAAPLTAAGPIVTPEEYDIQVVKANEWPGFGYELHAVVAVHVDVYLVWRIRRDKARQLPGYKPILKSPNAG